MGSTSSSTWKRGWSTCLAGPESTCHAFSRWWSPRSIDGNGPACRRPGRRARYQRSRSGLDKVRNEADREAVASYCATHHMKIVGDIPYDSGLADAERAGQPPLDSSAAAASVAAMRRLAAESHGRRIASEAPPHTAKNGRPGSASPGQCCRPASPPHHAHDAWRGPRPAGRTSSMAGRKS